MSRFNKENDQRLALLTLVHDNSHYCAVFVHDIEPGLTRTLNLTHESEVKCCKLAGCKSAVSSAHLLEFSFIFSYFSLCLDRGD